MNMLKTIALALLTETQAQEAKSCRALAMSGGGSKGAFEVGALWGLLKNDPNPEKYQWDVITGVSAGSLNAAIVTGFDIGKEDEMVEYASDLWKNTGNSDAYENWWGGMLRGLTDKSGVYNNAPEYQLVNRIIQELGTAKRKFVVSSVDVNTGNYVRFNETIPREEQYKAFTASSLIPGVFETLKWRGHVLMDGGTVWNTNFVDAVERCREQVDDDS
jgi:NTE family protein